MLTYIKGREYTLLQVWGSKSMHLIVRELKVDQLNN